MCNPHANRFCGIDRTTGREYFSRIGERAIMLERNLESSRPRRWDELGAGAPTVIALAELCSRAMADQVCVTGRLSGEARAILWAARERGIIEVRGNNTAYEAPSRFLTVYVELDEDRRLRFRNRADPAMNIRFFDGFRELCTTGLVMHHLYHEFSLTRAGFEFAATLADEDVRPLIDLGQECGPGD